MKISEMQGIGKANESKLNQAGILTAEQLCQLGAKAAFLKVKALVDEGACLHFLYDLDAAILNIKSKDLPAKRKLELKKFLEQLDKK
ncbi:MULTISPECIES: TfoX/Sxy family DNA transformation protein [unclassified Enterococcus]|uniref:TfoX/Sxy family DNA transformation protein n=1 Tax=unclassified Enterococcus TaxID=2608891 RepID=UPI001552D259|nr:MULTISPECIES: TfoX/Sxy family DNA transformation protein [unclassified Enterococcus]MBS7578214.1 TfoX/Sxy family DNA transformation protein [Enterococcus sp. MMGLQ5-2]MBS7585410.1 TfoX/Sxy family DNA transformation protein [Enterococcus sp. MMGLQ5-1]NPD13267.1 competence protein TfoX [Enterococcus sp. MMGLQ5-1]NPD38045.1 competence protein TfoX [Enterococcus sp. MMGLQ5-2]